MKIFGRSNAWFIGPLIVSIALAVNGVELSSIPSWLTNAAQIAIGISLGYALGLNLFAQHRAGY